MPHTHAHRRQPIAPTGPCQFQCHRAGDARAGHAQGVAQRNRTTIGVHARIIIRNLQPPQHRQPLCGKRLVQLDHRQISHRQPVLRQELVHRGHRTIAHDAWRDPGTRRTQNPGNGLQPVGLRCLGAGDDQRRRPVVHAAGIARRHRAIRARDGAQLGQIFSLGIPARVFVLCHFNSLAAPQIHRHRHDLGPEPPVLLRRPREPL